MPEPLPTPQKPETPSPASLNVKPAPGLTINIGEEFGTAKRNLPPMKIVAPVILVAAVVVTVFIVMNRAKPQGSGSLDNVTVAEIPGQKTVMVAMTFTLKNTSEKTFNVRTIRGKIKPATGEEASADARSAVDFERYFQAFPNLRNGAQPALTPDAKVPPDQTVTRTIMVALPVTLDTFNHRQSASVLIWTYERPDPIELTK